MESATGPTAATSEKRLPFRTRLGSALVAWKTSGGLKTLPSVALLAALTTVLYAPVLGRLVQDWVEDPDYAHGFLVPPFAAYILWRQRSRWNAAIWKPANFGLPVMLGGVGLLIAGTLGAELFISRFSLLVLLAGMVLFLAGWLRLRAVAFPLGYLIFMIPLPALIYYQVTFPLQLLTSRFAAECLRILSVPVLREGNLLYVPNYSFEVAQACSGIRSLLSLIALAVAYAHVVEPRWWARLVLVALMVPIAVVSNGFRVLGAGLLGYLVGPEWAEGFFHSFSGWLIFVAATVLMLLADTLLGRGRKGRVRANA